MLSIIIPAYNESRVIERCLDSVVKQKTYVSTEVIVIDDGSKDNTADTAERFLREHRIAYKVVRNKRNLGLSRSINRGIEVSDKRSDFIMILHSDIALKTSNWINKALKHFKNERVAVVTGRYIIPKLDDLDLFMKFCSLKYFRQSIRENGVYEISFIEGKCDIFRKDVLLKYLFNQDFRMSGEDQDLAYRLKNDSYIMIYDSSLVYESFLSNHQDSYLKVLKHEVDYAAGQVAINLRHRDVIRKGNEDKNLRNRMTFRLIQVFNVMIIILLLLIGRWDILTFVFLIRLTYSIQSYFKLHRDLIEVFLISLLDYFTDFAYFLGVLVGIFKVVSSN